MDTAILLTTNAPLSSSAAAIIMFVVLRTRKTYPGFALWTGGIACLALGAAALVPDVLPPGWATRVLRNAMLLGGLLLILRGMLVFRGQVVSYRLELAFALVFLALFGYYSMDPAQLPARIFIFIYCLFAAVLSLATVAVTLRRRPAYFGSSDVLLAIGMSVFALLSLLRIAHQLGDPGNGTAFEALKGFGSFYAMAQILTVQLVTLTLISINSQRIEYEYRSSEARLRASEEQLRSIGDNLPEGFVYQYAVVAGEPRFNYISAGVERLLGLQPAAVMADAQVLFALLDPESLARYAENEARSARSASIREPCRRPCPMGAGSRSTSPRARSARRTARSSGMAWRSTSPRASGTRPSSSCTATIWKPWSPSAPPNCRSPRKPPRRPAVPRAPSSPT